MQERNNKFYLGSQLHQGEMNFHYIKCQQSSSSRTDVMSGITVHFINNQVSSLEPTVFQKQTRSSAVGWVIHMCLHNLYHRQHLFWQKELSLPSFCVSVSGHLSSSKACPWTVCCLRGCRWPGARIDSELCPIWCRKWQFPKCSNITQPTAQDHITAITGHDSIRFTEHEKLSMYEGNSISKLQIVI